MMAIDSKVDICNMALSHLGNYGTVTNIDTPSNDKEITFSLWYDISRQTLLKTVMPNFALERRLVAEVVAVIPFGYTKAYERPVDCLKVLGLGDVDEKTKYTYAVEGNKIFSDDTWTNGAELRFIKDVETVVLFSPEFKMLLSWVLAGNVVFDITQDTGKASRIQNLIPSKMSELSSLNAQENPPIRISNSRFLEARHTNVSRNKKRK